MRHSRGRVVRKSCRKPCQGKVSVGLSSILALILIPGPCEPELHCSSIPTRPSLLPILDIQLVLTVASVLQQPQGWVWPWSPSPAHLLQELWDVAHRVQFMPWPIPLPPLAAQLFQSSLLLLPHCIFSISCNPHKKLKKKKNPIHPFILQVIHCITAKPNLLILLVTMQTSHIQK